MNNQITIIVLGIYTIVYVIIFFIQKSQISQTKQINESMKSFMDIFKIDEVKKYVELKNERILMQVDQLIADDEKVFEMSKLAVNEKIDDIKKVYIEQMGNQHKEMAEVIAEFLKMLEPHDRERFVKEKLNSTKHIFLPLIEKFDDYFQKEK